MRDGRTVTPTGMHNKGQDCVVDVGVGGGRGGGGVRVRDVPVVTRLIPLCGVAPYPLRDSFGK